MKGSDLMVIEHFVEFVGLMADQLRPHNPGSPFDRNSTQHPPCTGFLTVVLEAHQKGLPEPVASDTINTPPMGGTAGWEVGRTLFGSTTDIIRMGGTPELTRDTFMGGFPNPTRTGAQGAAQGGATNPGASHPGCSRLALYVSPL